MKKTFVGACILGVLVVLGGIAFANPERPVVQTAQNQVVMTVNDDQLRSALDPLKWNWKEVKDRDGLTTFLMVDGDTVVFALYQYKSNENGPVDSLGVSGGYDLPKGIEMAKVNQWNSTTRFTKAYTDDENDPYLTADMSLSGGTTLGAVRAFVQRFRDNQVKFEKDVLGRTADHKAPALR